MSTTNVVNGFFYISGSNDRPIGYNDNLNFGFNPSGTNPLFKYSVNSVQYYFIKPLNLVSISTDPHKTNAVLNMIIDGYAYGAEFERISNTDFIAKKLDIVSKILEYVYDHQDTVADASRYPLLYRSIGDEYLTTHTDFQGSYVTGSLLLVKSNLIANRISNVTFSVKYDGGIVRYYNFYLTPDDLLMDHGYDSGNSNTGRPNNYIIKEDEYNVKYHDETLTDPYSNFQPMVLNDTFYDVETVRNCTNVVDFKTTHVLLNTDGSIDKSVQQQFFIYSNMYFGYIPPVYLQIVLVKQYLEIKYSFDFVLLRKIYPDLFSDIDIEIFPMITNRVDNKIILPFTLSGIRDELTRRGSQVVKFDSTTINVEVFLLEGIGESNVDAITNDPTNNIFRIPMIAVNGNGNNLTDLNGAIGLQYPGFGIKASGMPVVGSDWEVLHFYITLFSRILLDMIPGDFANMTDVHLAKVLNVPDLFSLKTTKVVLFDINYLSSIKFVFNGSSYKIYGYNYGDVYGIN